MILLVRSGTGDERRFPLRRGVIVVGRGADCDVILAESQASRRHAELRRQGDQWLIVDVGSTNGTFLNGARLTFDAPRPLRPGDVIAIGATRLHLEQDTPPPEVYHAPQPAPPDAARPSAALTLLVWLSRLLVIGAAGALFIGAQAGWLRIGVTLPLLGNVFERTIGGAETGYAFLLLGAGAAGLLLLAADLLSTRWGLAVGLAQALLGAALAFFLIFDAYRFSQAGAQRIFGVNLLDVFDQYAREFVQVTALPGVYFVGGGLACLIAGGLLRLILAGMARVD